MNRFGLAAVVLTAAACSASTTILPPDPPEFVRFAYSPFKGDIRTRYGIEQTRILAAIPENIADLDIHQMMAPRTMSPAAIKAHYDRALTGWSAMAGLPTPWGGWAHGYQQDGKLFIVFGTPADAAGQVPVGIITNLKPERD